MAEIAPQAPHDGLVSYLGQYLPIRTINMLRNGPCWLRENIIIIINA